MNVVVIIVAAVACLFGGTMADDPLTVRFTGSTSSKGSTGRVLGCKPRVSPAHLVRFQAVRTGGVEYSRVRVPSESMQSSDVNTTSFGPLTFSHCVKAANTKKMDAFSFETGKCVGYKIGKGICPCTKGDLVLYRAPSAIRGPSSAKALTVAKERAEAAPLPAGYVRKIIYPTVSMTGDNFKTSSLSCEDVLASPVPDIYRPSLLHTVNGDCYYAVGFSNFPCTPCGGTATEVIVKEPPAKQTYLLSNCGGTIMAPELNMNDLFAGVATPELLFSHEGYGCIPYPNPVSDDNCDITVQGVVGQKIVVETYNIGDVDIDESAGTTCDGDELYVTFGSAAVGPCRKRVIFFQSVQGVADRVTIRFQRKPAYNNTSVNKGFALIVYATGDAP